MRRIKFTTSGTAETAWDEAVTLLADYLKAPRKADLMMDSVESGISPHSRRARKALFYSALRHAHRTRNAMSGLLKKPAKPLLEAILLTTTAEMIDHREHEPARVVHHAVERAKARISPKETAFLNAILRRLSTRIHETDPNENPAIYFSHPEWLVQRWIENFGRERTIQLLEWNQRIPKTYIRMDDESCANTNHFEPTDWRGFYSVRPGTDWEQDILPLLRSGTAYAKDPSTRFATDLLSPRPGERVLDLCASPGGKTRDTARMMGTSGEITAVDLPGPRKERLNENILLLRPPHPKIKVIGHDVLELTPDMFDSDGAGSTFDAVLLDAPCSNTGVIQRRTDIKLRLRPESLGNVTELQRQMLSAAARFVRKGGRLVYSTCSIERSENRDLVERFLESPIGSDFSLEKKIESYPWSSGHDGAGAFLLIRSASRAGRPSPA